MIQGFKDFIARGNAMEMAVGIIIGAAFGAVVEAITDKVLNPLIGAIFGQPDLDRIVVISTRGGEILPGAILTVLINFLLVAAAVLHRRCAGEQDRRSAPEGEEEEEPLARMSPCSWRSMTCWRKLRQLRPERAHQCGGSRRIRSASSSAGKVSCSARQADLRIPGPLPQSRGGAFALASPRVQGYRASWKQARLAGQAPCEQRPRYGSPRRGARCQRGRSCESPSSAELHDVLFQARGRPSIRAS